MSQAASSRPWLAIHACAFVNFTGSTIDHEGWALPCIEYKARNGRVEATQPLIDSQPTVEFVEFMLDRLSCFVEDFTAHCLQCRMPRGVIIAELPLAEPPGECPERFRDALSWEDFTRFQELWVQTLQPRLAKLSSRGKQITMSDVGHDIPTQRPEAIVDAVRQIYATNGQQFWAWPLRPAVHL